MSTVPRRTAHLIWTLLVLALMALVLGRSSDLGQALFFAIAGGGSAFVFARWVVSDMVRTPVGDSRVPIWRLGIGVAALLALGVCTIWREISPGAAFYPAILLGLAADAFIGRKARRA